MAGDQFIHKATRRFGSSWSSRAALERVAHTATLLNRLALPLAHGDDFTRYLTSALSYQKARPRC